LAYIGILYHKEHPPEVWHIPPGTLCIYQHFSICTACVQTLKDICDFVAIQCKNALNHTKIEWLSLLPAVKTIMVAYSTLASYFLSIKVWPTMLKKSVESKHPLLYAIVFLQSEMHNSNLVVGS
jgi:hypothetical protein